MKNDLLDWYLRKAGVLVAGWAVLLVAVAVAMILAGVAVAWLFGV